MDIPRRKGKLVFPRDCEKLDVDDCEHPKLEGKCVIKVARFSGRSTCIPNETYIIDREMSGKGFKEFVQLDRENLENDLANRNEWCKSLNSSACRSPQAKVLGCQFKKGFFTEGRCSLSDKIIKYYYKIEGTCLYKDCNEPRQKGFKLCEMHRMELNDIIDELNILHELIIKGEDIEKNYIQFVETYNDLVINYSDYLVENMGTLIALNQKYNSIRVFLGEGQCQCMNINGCIGKGKVDQFCQNQGIKTNYGLMCPKHRACYKDRKRKFSEFKKTFQKLCGLKSCKEELKELENFDKMLMFVTQGEAMQTKREVMDYLFIIRQYIKEISQI